MDWLEAIRSSTVEGNEIKIHLPYSGLLYLRKTDQTPESLYVHYYDNYGHELKYPVKVINLADYSLDDLVDKNLIFLLPFYLFNLEKELKSYDEAESRQRIITSYDDLIRYLNELQAQDKISVYIYSLVTEMLRKVTDNLAKKNDRARKKLDELMGGKILEFKNEKVYDEGRVDTLVTLVHNGRITAEVAAKQAAEFGISSEEFNKKLKAYADDEVLMQG